MLPSLNERERHDLIREFGSIKKILELETSQLETRMGKEMAVSISKDLEAFRKGESPSPEPLIVPIRYVEFDGAAEDLIPIEARLAPQRSRRKMQTLTDVRT